jgi:hypothetical protein
MALDLKTGLQRLLSGCVLQWPRGMTLDANRTNEKQYDHFSSNGQTW